MFLNTTRMESSVVLHQNTIMKKQTSITSFTVTATLAQQETAKKAWARAFYACALPFNVVNNPYFKSAITSTNPAINPPTYHDISTKYLDSDFLSMKVQVKSDLEECKMARTLCSDGWSDIRRQPIVNYIMCTGTEAKYLESVETKDNRHTAKYVADELERVAESWLPGADGGMKNIDAICLDNPNVNKLASEMLRTKYPHLQTIGCIPHILNLMVDDIMKILKNHSEKILKVVKFVRSHHIPGVVLMEKQKEKLGTTASPELPVKSRWGSVYRSFNFVEKSWESLRQMAIDPRCEEVDGIEEIINILLSEITKDQVHACATFLKPISDAIHFFEADKPLLSCVLPYFKKAEVHFQNTVPKLPVTKAEEEKIHEILSDRKKMALDCEEGLFEAATFLDPQFGSEPLDEKEFSSAVAKIGKIAKTYDLDVSQVNTDICNFNAKMALFSQVAILNAAKTVEGHTWWMGFFPKTELTKIALKILSMVGTVASADRIWSAYCSIQTKKRNRIVNDTANKLLLVQQNLMSSVKEPKKQKSVNEEEVCEFNRVARLDKLFEASENPVSECTVYMLEESDASDRPMDYEDGFESHYYDSEESEL